MLIGVLQKTVLNELVSHSTLYSVLTALSCMLQAQRRLQLTLFSPAVPKFIGVWSHL